ncbi:Uncharacterised protein [Neisseria gonorrhoeae]|uniref:Uncharacterized protein n=1 Tax=Neisseria gonorrhoeae TaxID=485 RepID=A0A378VYS9_NEIGO|nr:Uncharacterised protein [Neisseria gonorrhoeae]
MFGLLAAMAISNAQAEGNFLNLASKPAKIDGVLEASLDKPYPKFVQDWMKDSKLAGLGRIIQGKILKVRELLNENSMQDPNPNMKNG